VRVDTLPKMRAAEESAAWQGLAQAVATLASAGARVSLTRLEAPARGYREGARPSPVLEISLSVRRSMAILISTALALPFAVVFGSELRPVLLLTGLAVIGKALFGDAWVERRLLVSEGTLRAEGGWRVSSLSLTDPSFVAAWSPKTSCLVLRSGGETLVLETPNTDPLAQRVPELLMQYRACLAGPGCETSLAK
jgi:hypothetical protein